MTNTKPRFDATSFQGNAVIRSPGRFATLNSIPQREETKPAATPQPRPFGRRVTA